MELIKKEYMLCGDVMINYVYHIGSYLQTNRRYQNLIGFSNIVCMLQNLSVYRLHFLLFRHELNAFSMQAKSQQYFGWTR